jgi:serine phosphatase RsbU (regulator of sigma subunit)
MSAVPSQRARGADDRTRFERYQDGLVHQWCGTVALLGAVLVPVFVVLDWFMLPPEAFERFARFRGIVTGIAAVQVLVIRFTRPRRLSFLHGYATTLLVGGMIAWMTVELGGFDSSYYAGLNLVVAANLLLPWRTFHAALNSIATVLAYVVLNALRGGPFHVPVLANNLAFLISMVVLAITTASAKYALIRNEFAARTELLDANASLERSRVELKAARDALWGEMEVAKRIQTSLLPENRRVGDYEVAARMLTADEVGGDYYDIVDAGEGRHWIAIGDVSGHGVESGLVMMMTQTSILSLVRENPALTPAQVFREVNGVLLENISRLRASRYMTLNVVKLRGDGLTLAGKHQDVLVWRRATGRVEVVSNEGCWIGVIEDTGPHVADQAIPMAAGDVALFYTDGATEAMDTRGDMFGEDRLAAAFARVAERPLDEALETLLAEIGRFRAEQLDDVTLLLARMAPLAGERRGRIPVSAVRTPAA